MDIVSYQLKSPIEEVQVVFSDFSDRTVEPILSLNEIKERKNVLLIIEIDSNLQDDFLKEIHTLEHVWSWKIYCVNSSPLLAHLSDGLVADVDISKAVKSHQRKYSKYQQIHDNETPNHTLLTWLWMDTNRRILPLKNPLDLHVYSYPLLNLHVDINGADKFFLKKSINKQLLEEDTFVDRLRGCPQCDSNHLNYIEACPSCSSNHIHTKNSLHCFTCGFVEEENKFKKDNRLSCPKCSTQLKHIGVDYDRPLEVFECLDCNHDFIEANTLVKCICCESVTQVHDLNVEHLAEIKLGEAATELLLLKRPNEAPKLDSGDEVTPEYFVSLLAWANSLAQKDKSSSVLMRFALKKRKEKDESFGEESLGDEIDEIKSRIYPMLEDSDIRCSYQKNNVLVLLPAFELAQIPVLKNKFEIQLTTILGEKEIAIDAWQLGSEEISASPLTWLEGICYDR